MNAEGQWRKGKDRRKKNGNKNTKKWKEKKVEEKKTRARRNAEGSSGAFQRSQMLRFLASSFFGLASSQSSQRAPSENLFAASLTLFLSLVKLFTNEGRTEREMPPRDKVFLPIGPPAPPPSRHPRCSSFSPRELLWALSERLSPFLSLPLCAFGLSAFTDALNPPSSTFRIRTTFPETPSQRSTTAQHHSCA